MAETTDDETLLRTRTARLSQTEVGATLRASMTPSSTSDVDPADLPRITLDTREEGGAPLERIHRPDLSVVTTLGEGGMGRVHLARQRSLARDVAVKTLKEGATPAVAHALLREARVTGMLEHPGVIPVHALGVDEAGRPMLVMKRVDGVDLATRLGGKPQRGDDLAFVLEALMQVCRTCEFAHARGIIHRDIKPENVMLGGFGEVYLLDWGIAVRADAQKDEEAIVGTPVYMAPEMVRGRRVDARTDVYLLGATLHEMLTGAPRHAGRTIGEVARAAMLSEPYAYASDVPDALARLCNRATARDPDERPQSAAEMREEVAAFLRHRSARAIADAARERLVALERMLASSPGDRAPEDLSLAYRLVAEARFGLTQSLREDPHDEESREGMRRCLRQAIELEVRQGHVESAAALRRELDAPDATVDARIADARAREEAKAKERARLERIERDLDPTENASQRTKPILAVAVMLASVGLFITIREQEVTPRSIVIAAIIACLVLGVGMLALRRRLLTNAFNRRAGAVLLLGMASALGNRVIGMSIGRPAVQTFVIDLELFILLALAAALMLYRDLWICALALAGGLVAIELWPEYAASAFTASTFLNLALGALLLARARRVA